TISCDFVVMLFGSSKTNHENKQTKGSELRTLQPLPCNVLDQITNAAGVTPFVVIPGKDLDHVTADHAGVFSIHDRRVGILFEVGRYERRFRKTQNARELSVGRILQRLVYFFAG